MEAAKTISFICFFSFLALAAKASIFEYMIFMVVCAASDEVVQLRKELRARLPTDKEGV